MVVPVQPALVLAATALVGLIVTRDAAALAGAFGALAVFALPGFLLVDRPHRSVAASALAATTGIAFAISIDLLLALVIRPLPPADAAVLAAPFLAALALRLVVGPVGGPARAEDSPRWYDIAPPVAALAIAAGPLALAGARTADTYVFHAFFNADFFKHLAYVQATVRGFPPDNPFDPGLPANYYVGFHLIPALGMRLAAFGGPPDPVAVLKGVTLGLAPLLAAVIDAAIRAFGARRVDAAVATILALLGPNLMWLLRLPPFIADMQLRNVEADPLGVGATGSSLRRLLFYIPQHELGLAMLCAWVALIVGHRHRRDASAAAISAVLVLPSLAVSAIVGTWTLIVAIVATAVLRLGRILLMVTTLAATTAVAIPLLVGMAAPAGEAAQDPFLLMAAGDRAGLAGRLLAGGAMPLTLFGGLGLLALAEALNILRSDGARRERLAAWLLLLVLAGLVLADLLPSARLAVELRLKTSFIGWLLVAALAAVALGRSGEPALSRGFRGFCMLLVVCGLLTPVYDIAWHLDGPAASRTEIDAGEARLLREIRERTPADARIQEPLEPPFLLGGTDMLVPVLAGRSPAIATRSPRLDRNRAAEISHLFDPAIGPSERLQIAESLGLDALYLRRRTIAETYEPLAAALASEGWTRCLAADTASLWRRPGETGGWGCASE